jgi:hypothetical protein
MFRFHSPFFLTNCFAKNIEIVFQYIDELVDKKEKVLERKPIGYKIQKK